MALPVAGSTHGSCSWLLISSREFARASPPLFWFVFTTFDSKNGESSGLPICHRGRSAEAGRCCEAEGVEDVGHDSWGGDGFHGRPVMLFREHPSCDWLEKDRDWLEEDGGERRILVWYLDLLVHVQLLSLRCWPWDFEGMRILIYFCLYYLNLLTIFVALELSFTREKERELARCRLGTCNWDKGCPMNVSNFHKRPIGLCRPVKMG